MSFSFFGWKIFFAFAVLRTWGSSKDTYIHRLSHLLNWSAANVINIFEGNLENLDFPLEWNIINVQFQLQSTAVLDHSFE